MHFNSSFQNFSFSRLKEDRLFQLAHNPARILPLGTSVFQEFFPNLTEVLINLKLPKKRSNYRFRVPPQMRRTQKIFLFSFLTIFDKNTGHNVTKICPDYLICGTYKSYLIIFPVTPKNNFFELEKSLLNKICRYYWCEYLDKFWSPCDQYFCHK